MISTIPTGMGRRDGLLYNRVGLLGLGMALALGNAGCLKSALLNGQISATRQAADAIDTMSDFEIARSTAYAGLGQFEGMHHLAPSNEDALFLLLKAWTATSFGFIEDDFELATDADDDALSEYHRARARAAYTRAVDYGVATLERRFAGFDGSKANRATMQRHLAHFDKDDAPTLLWLGQAWLGRVNIAKDDTALVADLHVGEALVERSLELDENLEHAAGHVALGAYHARAVMAELDASFRHFSRAIALTQGRALLPKVQLAKTYYCMKGDKASYEKTLREVIDAGDGPPDLRLQNVIAKRRAHRYLQKKRMADCGF